jgi:hypothetical protein
MSMDQPTASKEELSVEQRARSESVQKLLAEEEKPQVEEGQVVRVEQQLHEYSRWAVG